MIEEAGDSQLIHDYSMDSLLLVLMLVGQERRCALWQKGRKAAAGVAPQLETFKQHAAV